MSRSTVAVTLGALIALVAFEGPQLSSNQPPLPAGAATRATATSSTNVDALPRRLVIGHSTRGRDLVAVRRGPRSSPHTVLVVGIIHGNEKAGRRVVSVLRNRRIPKKITLWTIRALNPDGKVANTRQNGRGVDLNRNFPRDWRPIGRRWSTYYSGPRRLSEPESRAARRFILKVRPDITIWYHQAMRLIVKTGTRRHGHRIQRRYARLVGLPLKRLGFIPGTATRWQNHRFPRHTAFVVELPGGAIPARSARRHARAVLDVATR